MAGTSWPALQAGKKARASDVEAKFDWIEGNIVPMNAGTQTSNAYDLGTSAYSWRYGYFGTSVFVLSTGSIGIGTTSPAVTLHAEKSVADTNVQTPIARFVPNSTGDMANNFGGSIQFGIRDTTSGSDNLVGYLNWYRSNSTDTSGDIEFRSVNDGADALAFKINYNASVQLASGTSVNQISTDGTFSDNSDNIIPTQQAVKEYVDSIDNSGCRVYMDSATSGTVQTSASGTKVPFNIETYDNGNEYDNTTNYRFTAANAGNYLIAGSVGISTPNTSSIYYIQIQKNGSATSYIAHQADGIITGSKALTFSDSLALSASDYIEIYAFNAGGGTAASIENPNLGVRTFLTVHRVS